MAEENLVAKASITINASNTEVWNALVNPEAIKQFMFGAQVVSDWQVGEPIVWKGEWQGKAYEDKGVILRMEPGRTMQYSHFSPLSGVSDLPENYHTVTIELTGERKKTHVWLTQDNNADENERDHSQTNWKLMLTALKMYLEEGSGT